ncbi:aldehyde dehydrogenase [Jiangella asiatica]|uniref:Aldehyde dehydrogenase n=1 Tax=Jiangella asiatica TaxID=2530372 RepID=A0A4R5DHY4_9ACTN|nr:aldehyde dehydrogenase [Jiangella asiatica]TDE13489.1 aldehyde dehydrogenase [Jiangella asiatica]
MRQQLYIDGTFTDAEGDRRFVSTNPFDGTEVASLPDAAPGDVDRALRAARAAFDGEWGHTSGVKRARHLLAIADLVDEHAERLSRLETSDNGKVIRETSVQMGFVARTFRYYAGWADKLHGSTVPLDNSALFDFTLRQPYGVIAVITAWNSPLVLLANKVPAALAAGNTVVVKPSEHASTTTLELAKLIDQAGLPAGVFNVVSGGPEAGAELVGSAVVDKVSFTGGPAAGSRIAQSAAARCVPVTLELGGKSANIVFADADLDRAIVGAVAGIYAAAGQTCIAGSRLLVHESIHDAVVDEVVRRAEAIRLGDPLDPETEMGPVANRPQYERILSSIAAAEADGAVRRTTAPVDDVPGGGALFIRPTVFTGVEPDMAIARDEVFGPVLCVIPFSTDHEAVEIANGTEYGLASGVWTENLTRAVRMSRALRAGVTWVNTYRTNAVQAPFGGIKRSGYGRERGEDGIREFTYTKNVMIDVSGGARDPFSLQV